MSAMRIRRFQPGQIFQWLSCGWRLFRLRSPEALRPAAVFSLAALLLLKIPVLGNVLFLLFLPTFLASYFQQAHRVAMTGSAPPTSIKGTPAYMLWGRELQQTLLGAWSKTENIFPLILFGGALVVLGLVAMFLFNAIGGQAVVSQHEFFELTAMQMVWLLLAYGVVALLWAVIAGMTMWSLPMLTLRDMDLDDALRWGMRGFTRNVGAMVIFMLLLAAAGLLPGAIAKLWWPFWHHIVQWLLLTFFSALFGFGGYCSYRLVFADIEERTERPSPPRPMGPNPPPPPGVTPKPGPRRS